MITCYLIPVDEEIAIQGAKWRHESDWDLEDALIYATAVREGATVLTGIRILRGWTKLFF